MSNIHAIFILECQNPIISSTSANIWKLLHSSGEKKHIYQAVNKHQQKREDHNAKPEMLGFRYISVWFL